MQLSTHSTRAIPTAALSGVNQITAHPGWNQARAAALETLETGGLAILLGPPGSGKSLLLRELAETLRQTGRSVRLVRRLDILANVHPDEILLVDELDALGTEQLAVMASDFGPALLAAATSNPDQALGTTRPVRRIMLRSLPLDDVARLVKARLASAGQPADLLEPEAVLALAQHSGGLPRRVNVIMDTAIVLARLDRSVCVAVRHTEQASLMRPPSEGEAMAVTNWSLADPIGFGPTVRSPKHRHGFALHLAASGGLAITLLFLPWLVRERVLSPGQINREKALPVLQGALSPTPQLPTVTGAGLPKPPELVPSSTGASAQTAATLVPGAAVPRTDTPWSMALEEPKTIVGSSAPLLFHGPIFNETMGQGGHLTLTIVRQKLDGAITAKFAASRGLSGSGMLAGTMSETGYVSASGQLSMGRNPFTCELVGTFEGNILTGFATFTRGGNSPTYRSRFNLLRA